MERHGVFLDLKVQDLHAVAMEEVLPPLEHVELPSLHATSPPADHNLGAANFSNLHLAAARVIGQSSLTYLQ